MDVSDPTEESIQLKSSRTSFPSMGFVIPFKTLSSCSPKREGYPGSSVTQENGRPGQSIMGANLNIGFPAARGMEARRHRAGGLYPFRPSNPRQATPQRQSWPKSRLLQPPLLPPAPFLAGSRDLKRGISAAFCLSWLCVFLHVFSSPRRIGTLP